MSSGGKGGKAPKAPDYSALAQQQADLNKQAAEQQTAANRPNQYDAFGNSVTWNRSVDQNQLAQATRAYQDYVNSEEGWNASSPDKLNSLRQAVYDAEAGTGWEQHQTLSPEIKAIWDKYISDSGSAMSSYGDKLNSFLSNYSSPEQYNPEMMGKFTQRELKEFDPNSGKAVADALYGSVMDRGRVEQGRETDRLNTQLRQQGLVPGSEAYNRAMQNLMTSQNDANLLAGQNATLAGAQEARDQYSSYLMGQGQGFNQDLSSFGANNGATQQNNQNRFQAMQYNRNQPLQELAGLAGIAGGQPYSPSYPNYSGATGYQPADLVGAANAQYSAAMNSANAGNSKKGGLLGAGASLGGSYLGSK